MASRTLPRVLLLGGSGQIGFELRTALAGLGQVWCPTRRELDLSDQRAAETLIMDCAPRYIVNAAAYTAVDRAESEPELAHAVNALAPALLARCARALDALLVHYSTDYVFDGSATRAYREDDATAPGSVYGQSKLAGEQAILASDPRALIFRTSWIYGQRGSNFLLTVRRLAPERERLRIVADQSGSPTWCRGVASATVQVLEALGDTPLANLDGRAGIYHMSAGGHTTWHGFARAIVELDPLLAARRDLPVQAISTADYPTPARRPAFSVLDNTRLETHFGIRLKPWREMLCEALKADPASGASDER